MLARNKFAPIIMCMSLGFLWLSGAQKAATEFNPCENVAHSSSGAYTCCGGETLDAGIDFADHYTACFYKKRGLPQGDLAAIAWFVYQCILEAAKITDIKSLVMYTSVMTKNYPVKIKEQIREQATETSNLLKFQQNGGIRAVRAAYHLIERGFCEGKNVTLNDIKELDREDCKNVYQETIHARGDCCKDKVIPLRLEYFPREPEQRDRQCLKTMMMAMPRKSHGGYYMQNLTYEESDAQQLCLKYCMYHSYFNTRGPTIDKFMMQNVPRTYEEARHAYSTPKIVVNGTFYMATFLDQSAFAKFVTKRKLIADIPDPANYTLEIQESMINRTNKILISEFSENVTLWEIEPFMVMCEAHNDIHRRYEQALMEICA